MAAVVDETVAVPGVEVRSASARDSIYALPARCGTVGPDFAGHTWPGVTLLFDAPAGYPGLL